jgi:thymidylate synthase
MIQKLKDTEYRKGAKKTNGGSSTDMSVLLNSLPGNVNESQSPQVDHLEEQMQRITLQQQQLDTLLSILKDRLKESDKKNVEEVKKIKEIIKTLKTREKRSRSSS